MQAAGENLSDGRVTEGKRLKSYGDHIYNESIRLKRMIENCSMLQKLIQGSFLQNKRRIFYRNLQLSLLRQTGAILRIRDSHFTLHMIKTCRLLWLMQTTLKQRLTIWLKMR